MSSLISAVSWVRRGVSARHPQKYVLDDEELQRVSVLAGIELEDARLELQRAHEAAKSMGRGAEGDEADEDDEGDNDGDVVIADGPAVENGEGNEDEWVDEEDSADAMDVDFGEMKIDKDDLSQYKLDEYDDDVKTSATGPFSNIKGLTYYRDNNEDPYITMKDESDDEREDLEVLPTDNLLVIAKTEDDISQLEIYVYDESQDNVYAHHDLMLPNFPLCLEWLDFPPASISTPTGANEKDDDDDDDRDTLTSPSSSSQNRIKKKKHKSKSKSKHNPPPPPSSSYASGYGNYIAVGTLDPEIEIWSLDTIEAMYPTTVLGRPDQTKAHVPTPLGTGKKKKKKTKHRTVQAGYHVDAVLGLSWNRHQRNLLASASADRTVKLWDLSRDASGLGMNVDGGGGGGGGAGGGGGGAIRSFDVHKDKVQAVQWNDKEPSVLLTGSFDRTVRTFDSRAPDAGVGAALGSDVEALRWDPWESHGFYVSLENGLVLNFDARTLPSSPLTAPCPARFTLSAHDGPTSSIDVNPHIRGCIVTGGTDKLVKVWNVTDDNDDGHDAPKHGNKGAAGAGGGGKRSVSLVTSRDLGVGKVFSTVWSPDDPLTLAAAGSKAKLQIWDVAANFGARKAFGAKLREAGRVLKEKQQQQQEGVVGVASDEEESDEDD